MQDAVAKVRVMKERRGIIAELFGKGVGNACWNMNGGLMMPTKMWDEDVVWFGVFYTIRSDVLCLACEMR